MKRTRIAVTGIGAITAAGPDAAAFAAALKNPKRLFRTNTRFDLDFEVAVAEADWSSVEQPDSRELSSATGRLCLAAARECAADARNNGAGRPDGLALGTSTGGQLNNEEAVFSLLDGRGQTPGFGYQSQGCMAAPARLVARELGITGPVQTVSTACTSSANAIALGAEWIRSGRCGVVLAGGGDALCRTTIASFRALDLTGPGFCSPFGADRPGMTLGEGAGFLMLESMDDVVAAGRPFLAELAGAGMSSDAHHMTAPPEDGAGAELAMRLALESAGLSSSEVSHVNAHGTGTKLNDAAEAQAISRLLGGRVPVMSCKGVVGHTLGGAGGVEAVASALAIRMGRCFENLGAVEPGDDCPISLVGPGGRELPNDAVVLSNSFAFGGNNCALVFRAPGAAR